MDVASRKPAGPAWHIAAWLPRILVAGLFAYTGVYKLRDLGQFIKEVQQYQLIPIYWSHLFAYSLPWLEIFAALLLLVGLWRGAARLVLLGLLVSFAVGKSYAEAQGYLDAGCGCLPKDSPLYILFGGWMGVVTNIVLIALLSLEISATRVVRKRARTPRPATGELTPHITPAAASTE